MNRLLAILMELFWWLLVVLAALAGHPSRVTLVVSFLLAGTGWVRPLLWAPSLMLLVLPAKWAALSNGLLLLLTVSGLFCLAGGATERYRVQPPSLREQDLRLAAVVALLALWLTALLAHALLYWRSTAAVVPGGLSVLTVGSAAAGIWLGSSTLLALADQRSRRGRLLLSLLAGQAALLVRGLF